MTESQIKEQSKEVIVAKYESYLTGQITREDWILYILDLLENYFKHLIKLKKRTIGAPFEDLMQESRLAVIANIDKYDPNLTVPSSFFTQYINDATKKIINRGALTSYYLKVATKLDKKAKENGFEGLLDSRLTPDTLSVIADVPITTVVETIKYKSTTFASYDESGNTISGPVDKDYMKSPEAAYIERESYQFLEEQLNKCTPLERFLLEKITMSDNPVSYRYLVKKFKEPEFRVRFENELPAKVEQVFLEQKHNHALRKIRFNKKTKKYFVTDEEDDFEIVSAEDIESAICDGIFDFEEGHDSPLQNFG